MLPCQSLELLGYRTAFPEMTRNCEGLVRVRNVPAHLASPVEWTISSLVGLAIEVSLAEAFATHTMTIVAHFDGERCLERRVPVDGMMTTLDMK